LKTLKEALQNEVHSVIKLGRRNDGTVAVYAAKDIKVKEEWKSARAEEKERNKERKEKK
jgi:hypothetical protein